MKTNNSYLDTITTAIDLIPHLVLLPMSRENLMSYDMVHTCLEDLVFVLGITNESENHSNIIIPSVEFFRKFNYTKKDLINYALKNMTECKSIFIKDLGKLFSEMFDLPTEQSPLYALGYSNYSKSEPDKLSSIILLDDHALQEAAKKISSNANLTEVEDLYILPSSKHEVIAIRKNECDLDPYDMLEIVTSINSGLLTSDEKLSNSVYLYDAKLHEVRKIA